MMRKFLSILLVVVTIVSLIGCNGQSVTSGTKVTEDTNNSTSSEDNTLTVWCWDPAFNIFAMEQAGEIYKTHNPDFSLNVIETPWPDIQTKLTTAATSGDLSTLPDVLLMQDNAFLKNAISYPDAFIDLTDSGIDYTQFAEAKTAYSIVEGKNYGVPFDNGTVIACYRTDILEQAGYTIDDFTDITWSEYLSKGQDVLVKTGKPLLSCTAGQSDVIMMMLQSAGASLFDEEGNPTIVDNATLKIVMDIYAELIKAGVLIELNDWDQYISSMNSGTVAGTINGCWIMASIQSADDQSGKWAITNMPKLEGIGGATNYSNNGGSSWVVTSNCKNKELAYDFLSKTFAGSTELYERILPSSGALSTYLPAADSKVYGQPSEFFCNDTVFSKITDFASKTPSNNTGVYYYEALDAVTVAITDVVAGGDLDVALKNAQDTVSFAMGN